MFFYPYKHLHNESAIHITLLDSFGDYFDLYWENDASNFYKLRHDFFVFENFVNYEIFAKHRIAFFWEKNLWSIIHVIEVL